MRLNGHDFDAKPLTVRELLAEIERLKPRVTGLLDMPVHFLAMEDTDASAYVTHVDIDAFDGTEADPDGAGYRAVFALCLYHRVSP